MKRGSNTNPEDELVPHKYRVKAPSLVWASRTITWHGRDLDELCSAFSQAMEEGNSDLANGIAIELLVSGYISKIWDAILKTIMLQGLGLRIPHLWSMFLSEYKSLNSIRNRLNRLGRPWDVANHQEYRNHLAQCISVICLAIRQGWANPLPLEALARAEVYVSARTSNGEIDGESSEGSNHARSVAQEYILLTKTPESPAVGMQELHFNLSRFLQAVNRDQDQEQGLQESFFWIHEIVSMREPSLHLRKDFQYYMPRPTASEADWVSSPSNILWNYLFIRTPDRYWRHLASLMEVFTFCYKRREDLTCSAILYNLLLLLMQEREDRGTPRLHDAPPVIRTVLGINRAFLTLKQNGN